MYCSKCGTKNNDDANFCRNCGAPLARKAVESYAQAVELALAGDEKGFSYLYEETYKSKYYLALKYMDDKDAAEDVLQDSYIKAFSKLDSLKKPETFPSWLGTIVANTAKNALQKKNPVLFTDLPSGEEETDLPDFEVEDESVESQPEAAYTKQETEQLVHELIDSLSEEQKMCILMYYIDGESVRDIAESLDCTESAVKSRLSYGRKNLKAKAEELQKKGYKLFTLAPIPLLLALVHKDAEAAVCEKEFIAAGRRVAEEVLKKAPQIAKTAAASQAGGTGAAAHQVSTGAVAKAAAGAGVAGKGGAGTGAVVGFISSTAGKAVIFVVAAAVVIGGVGGGVHANRVNQSKEETVIYEDDFVQEETEQNGSDDTGTTPSPFDDVSGFEADAEVANEEDFVSYFEENDIEMTPQGEIALGVAGPLNSDYDVEGTAQLFVTLETVDSDEEGYSDTVLTIAPQGDDLEYNHDYYITVGMFDYYTGEILDPYYSDTDWGESGSYEYYVTMPDGTLCACSSEVVPSKLNGKYKSVYTLHHPTEYDGAVFKVTGSSSEELAYRDVDVFYENVEESLEYDEEYGLDSYFFRDSPSDYGTGENSNITKVSIGGVEFIPEFVKLGCEVTPEGSVEMNLYGDLDGDGIYETPGSCTAYVTMETVPSAEEGYSDTIATFTYGEINFNAENLPQYYLYGVVGGLAGGFCDYYTGEELQGTIILPDGTEFSCYWYSESEINEEGETVFTITAHHPSDYDGAVFLLRGWNPLDDGDLTIEDIGEDPSVFLNTCYFMSTDISAENNP